MKKHVLLTILENNDGLARALGGELARLGLDVQAHIWQDDAEKLAFAPVINELAGNTAAWIIAGETASFEKPSIRKALGLAALAAQQTHGHDFPILISPARLSDKLSFQGPLSTAEIVTSNLGVKAVARANARRSGKNVPYRLDVHALPGIGLWLEVGPSDEPWAGAFLGTSSSGSTPVDPDAHGVGPARTIPNRCTLRYPIQGMKLSLGETEYTAWGVQNQLSPAESYFVRLNGLPDGIVFGPFPTGDSEEVFSLRF